MAETEIRERAKFVTRLCERELKSLDIYDLDILEEAIMSQMKEAVYTALAPYKPEQDIHSEALLSVARRSR